MLGLEFKEINLRVAGLDRCLWDSVSGTELKFMSGVKREKNKTRKKWSDLWCSFFLLLDILFSLFFFSEDDESID